jgi:NAD(P)-dependent dehydrogenase (short-subunit alcohol dehydrogenase family)
VKLVNKVAVITGAGSGIGWATAILFAQEGAKVVVADLVERAGEETVAQIREAGGEATFVRVDVANEAEVKAMIRTAIETYGRLDILYNNAGLTLPASVTETTEDIWIRSIDVNLKGVMLGCKHAIPAMQKGGGGSIINTASMLGLVASPNQAPYCAAKGGVVMLTKQMAVDYARDNIRVNCICPSEVDTPMHRKFIAESPDPEATRRRLLDRIPLARVAQPEEIATVALFLASDDSSYITGVALPVDGGLTAL